MGGVFNSPAGKLVRSWLFQGVLYMSPDELLFRIAAEVAVIGAVWWLIADPVSWSGVLAVIVVHTLFWLVNSHFWALEIRKGVRLVKNRPQAVKNYLEALRGRCTRCRSIKWCFASGSLARGAFGVYSDLDVACIPRPGNWNRIVVLAFGMRERLIAAFKRMPVELYCYSEEALAHISPEECRLVLKGPGKADGDMQRWMSWDCFWDSPSEFFQQCE
ncbi:uncharacterized protein FOKN1_0583 [Thiohalobacter thiocyanaticus]|uniref:Uncharacterized protein n=1 Tax=Thiohalobacter thiocyanaticus TaxID=585455 RepID=A0A1Z4VNA6_9GAMM|nr:uncharacterized protein FOKN1_0583 [Thiohalobacter thiocyanaticus]